MNIEQMAREAARTVEDSYGMGGLSGGFYEDFAVDVAKIVAQAVARRCAEICEDRAGTVSMFATSREARAHNATVRGCAAAIRAEFGFGQEKEG